MPGTHPTYAPEFKQQIIELARLGRTAAELAREFEPTYETIRTWIRQAEREEGRPSPASLQQLEHPIDVRLDPQRSLAPGLPRDRRPQLLDLDLRGKVQRSPD